MKLSKIRLKNFRNLKEVSLNLDNHINLFIGNNGQGKTNLLESIYMISLTKSFKTNKLENIINFNEDFFKIEGYLTKKDYNYYIEYSFIKKNKEKQIRINNNNFKKYSDIIGLLNVVLFVPEDLSLLKGNPSLRRKMLDIELSKVDLSYFNNLTSYHKVLKERNILLKESNHDQHMYDTLNELLVNYGSKLSKKRSNFINDISLFIEKNYQLLSNSLSKVNIIYKTNIYKEEDYLSSLGQSIDKDKFLKQTTIGIHRDDLIFNLNDKDAGLYASQGEQRTLVLALKLSLVEYIYNQIGEYPLLLLDDVMSELDDTRQINLINYLNKEVQTFITTTNLEVINEKISSKATIFTIDSGIVKEDINE
ncbi:MAG: DNA replication/repair protein RecF [Bacilli bacterium]